MPRLHNALCSFRCAPPFVRLVSSDVHSVPRCSASGCALSCLFSVFNFFICSPRRDVSFRPCVEFLVLRLALGVAFVPRCGTS